MARARVISFLLSGALAVVTLARGEPGPGSRAAPQPDAQAGAPDCATAKGSLAGVTCELSLALLPRAAGADVSVIGLSSDSELPEPLALRERVRELVAGALAAGQPAAAPTAGRGASSKLRVELSVEVKGSAFSVSADLRRGSGFWQRLRRSARPIELHAYATRPIDRELRALIPPPPLVVSEIVKVKAPERGLLALACGDLGADGAQELALVSRAGVRVGRIVKGHFSELYAASWQALSPIAPAPLREPLGSADITPQGTLRVGLSDRREALELDAKLAVLARLPGLLPLPGGGCVARAGLGYAWRDASCAAGERRDAREPSDLLDALSGGRAGVGAPWSVGRDLLRATLRVRHGAERFEPPGRVGAQLALGDADDDGAPELAYSLDTLDPARDGVQLATLDARGALRKRFELGAPGLQALAICQRREGRGMAPLVLATLDELWLIR